MSDVIQDPEDPSRYLIGNVTDRIYGENQGLSVIENVHPATACIADNCVIHNPSDHHIRAWPLTWRDDKGVMERSCPHGVGHPDPDDANYLVFLGVDERLIHGCDGCCQP